MPKIREVLVVPHTHHDIGYTHAPDIITRMHKQFVHEAIRLASLGDDNAPESFRWTVEISRPLVAFLRDASLTDLTRMQDLVVRGRISLSAAYMHMTQLIGHEEYVRYFEPVRRIRAAGLPVSVVQHGDINGLSWGVVPLMREIGLDCLVMALNTDHGRAPFEQPSAFYWEGPDGSRILVWLNLFYSIPNNPWELMLGRIEQAREPLMAVIERLEARDDYPFDFLILHAAEDNMLPNAAICEGVRAWNAAGLQPPLRIATLDQAVQLSKARIADLASPLPVVRGEWADWWAHGHGSTAVEVGLSRLARAELRKAEMVRAVALLSGADFRKVAIGDALPIVNWYRVGNALVPDPAWQTRVSSAYEDLLLFEEHTWGTFESVRLPFTLFTATHWAQKAHFAYRAVAEAHDLAREALAAIPLPPADQPALVVFNPLSARRDELVSVRTPGVDHAVFVRDLPPLGVRVVPWDVEGVNRVSDLPSTDVIENEFYRIEVDSVSAAITSLFDKELNREFADSASYGLGTVLYETPAPGQDHPALTEDRNQFHPTHPGPQFIYTPVRGESLPRVRRVPYGLQLAMAATGPFMPRIVTTITLYDTVKRVDLMVTMDKVENYDIEGVYIAFPFALPNPTFWLETANAAFRAELDQIPDSCRDWYSIQHGIGVQDGEAAASVLWATREAPLVQLGALHTGEWAHHLVAENGHIYSWPMNNLYFTNFKAAQGGRMSFSYRFTTGSGAIDGAAVRAWGEAFAMQPLARISDVAPGEYEWLSVLPDTVQVQAFKPAWDGIGYILRLKETSGRPTRAEVIWKGRGVIDVFRTNYLENVTGVQLADDRRSFVLPVAAHELVTLRLIPQ